MGTGIEKQTNGTDRAPEGNLYHRCGNTDQWRKAE